MADTPVAPRLRRPSWRDPRLGVGVLLVAASVALGSWVFTQSSATVEAYIARDALVPGQRIAQEDLDLVQVHLADVQQTYLTPDGGLGEDAVVLRMVGAGELVPAAAVGHGAQLDLRPVTIPTAATAAASLARGDQVDIWVARPDPDAQGGALAPPEQLLTAAHVAHVHEDTGLFAGGNQAHVELLVGSGDLADVLGAMSSGAEVILVPGPGG